MKQSFHILCIVCFLLLACQSCHRGYTINGTVTGENVDGQTVTLLELRGLNSPAEIQKTTVKDGRFTMKGVVAYPDMHLLYVNGNGPVEVFVENTSIQVDIPQANLDSVRIEGSVSHDEFQHFLDLLQPYQMRMSDLADSADIYASAIDTLVRPEAKMTESEWAAYTDSLKTAITDSMALLLRETALNGKFFIYEWVTEHKDAHVAAFIAYEMLKNTSKTEEIIPIVEALDNKELQNSQWLRLLKTHLRYMQHTVEGATYTDFTMPSWNGGDVTLSDYVGKNPYVVLYFWAAWNPISRTYQKELKALYEKYAGKGVAFVSVSLDNQFEDWDLALKEDSIPWVQLSSLKGWKSEPVELYNLYEIPQTFVINNEGTILLRIKDPSELWKNFEQVLPDDKPAEENAEDKHTAE